MGTLAISVTEFSRSLSEFLNQVQYRGQVSLPAFFPWLPRTDFR